MTAATTPSQVELNLCGNCWCISHPNGWWAYRTVDPDQQFVRPSDEDERRALGWLMDVRENGGPLERRFARTVIDTLAYFEQEVPVDTRP